MAYNKQNKLVFIGNSIDNKPTGFYPDNVYADGHELIEKDTLDRYIYLDGEWVFVENLKYNVHHTFLFNTETLDWEASTKGTGTGQEVSVDNFPAVISGASVPVTGAFYQVTQPVSAEDLPLPSGAATANKQLADGHNVAVNNFPATQTVDGTVDVGNFPTNFQIDSQVDLDVAITYNADKINVMTVTGFGKTKTMTFGWDVDNLTSISTVIA